MIALVIGIIIAILVVGLLFKLLKFAILVALAVGIVMFAQNAFGNKRIK